MTVRCREAERSWNLPDPPTSARTDPQGRFRVVLDTRAALEVRIQAKGFAPKVLAGVRSGQRLDVWLEKGRSLEGLIRDASSGKPVAGARVEAWPATWGRRDPLDEGPSGGLNTESDARGRFSLEGLGAAPTTVTVTSPGHAVLRREARAGAPLDLLLLRGVSIGGFVRDAEGRPVAGALVQAETDLVKDPLPATTDTVGRFAIAGVDDRPYRVWARGPDGATSLIEDVTVAEDEDARVDLIVPRPSGVGGRLVSPGGKPVAGTVAVAELDGRPSRVLPSLVRCEAAGDGRFRLSGLPPGSHALAASAPGFATKRVEVAVEDAEPAELGDVELERGLSIRGRVQDAGGLPVAGARIRAFVPATGVSVPEALADADGGFTLAGLPEGTYTVTASAAGYGEARREIATRTGNATITLRPGGAISGQVVDPKGAPIETFSVSARSTHEDQGVVVAKAPTTVEDPNGRFTIEDLPEGTFLVEVFAEGKRPGSATDVVVKAGATADAGRIRLDPGGIVRGVVVDSRGAPIASARVVALGPGLPTTYRSYPEASTGLDGTFELRGAALGAVDVYASHPEFAAGKAAGVVVEGDAPAAARVVLTAGGSIEGRALRRDGTGIPGAYVSVSSIAMAFQGFRDFIPVSPDDGSFRAEKVPPGEVFARLMTRAGNAFADRRSKRVTVLEGETVTVDFPSREILVSGRVSRGGEPLAGVRVAVGSAIGMTHGSGFVGTPEAEGPAPGIATSLPDGSYALVADEPGRTFVSVESLDRRRKYLQKRLDLPDADSFALDLAIPGTTAAGVVVDKETGEPLHPASVTAFPKDPGSGQPLGTDTGPDGRFEIDLPPGDSRIQAQAPGHAKQTMDVSVAPSGISGLRFALPKGGTIEGKVVDAAGRPVAGLHIDAIAGEGGWDFESTHGYPTLGDGSFRVEGLSDRPYTLFAGSELSGFGLAPQVPSGASGILLSLQPGGRVQVSVRGPDGLPAAGAGATLERVGGFAVRSPGLFCTTSTEGQCEMAAPQGPVVLRVQLPSAHAHASVAVEVPAQGLAEAKVSFSP